MQGHIMALVSVLAAIDPNVMGQASQIVDSAPTSLKSVLVATFSTIVLGAAGTFIYRRQRSGNALEDTTNNLTVETLQLQAARLIEKDTRIRALEEELAGAYDQIREAKRGLISAETEAMTAQYQARVAAEAAQRAQEAADRAKREVAHVTEYTDRLQGLLEEGKISYPPLAPLPGPT